MRTRARVARINKNINDIDTESQVGNVVTRIAEHDDDVITLRDDLQTRHLYVFYVPRATVYGVIGVRLRVV